MKIFQSAKEGSKRVVTLILETLRTIFDILLFLLSFKVFPLAWHARSYYSFIFRYKLDNRPVPLSTLNTPTIFQPTIWTSTTPLGEIDILGHKTNSTYATDFDAARNYHICSLFRVGMKSWGGLSFINPQKGDGHDTGLFYPALAGVSFTFHKAIRPRQKYEICTRVLSWDDKWIHLISHFVERGSCDYIHLSDQRNPQRDPEMNFGKLEDSQSMGQRERPRPVIFATGMAKIVFKKGKRTVSPSQFLGDCGLLPQRDKVSTHQVANNFDDNNVTSIVESIERIRTDGYRVSEHLNSLDEGRSFYDMNERVFFSKC